MSNHFWIRFEKANPYISHCPSVGRSVDRSVDRSVGRSVGRSVPPSNFGTVEDIFLKIHTVVELDESWCGKYFFCSPSHLPSRCSHMAGSARPPARLQKLTISAFLLSVRITHYFGYREVYIISIQDEASSCVLNA